MAHHQRPRDGPLAATNMQVAMTHPGSGDLHLHLAGTGIRQLDIGELDRPVTRKDDSLQIASFGVRAQPPGLKTSAARSPLPYSLTHPRLRITCTAPALRLSVQSCSDPPRAL